MKIIGSGFTPEKDFMGKKQKAFGTMDALMGSSRNKKNFKKMEFGKTMKSKRKM